MSQNKSQTENALLAGPVRPGAAALCGAHHPDDGSHPALCGGRHHDRGAVPGRGRPGGGVQRIHRADGVYVRIGRDGAGRRPAAGRPAAHRRPGGAVGGGLQPAGHRRGTGAVHGGGRAGRGGMAAAPDPHPRRDPAPGGGVHPLLPGGAALPDGLRPVQTAGDGLRQLENAPVRRAGHLGAERPAGPRLGGALRGGGRGGGHRPFPGGGVPVHAVVFAPHPADRAVPLFHAGPPLPGGGVPAGGPQRHPAGQRAGDQHGQAGGCWGASGWRPSPAFPAPTRCPACC